MEIYFDESGDFSLNKQSNISIVGSLICTDSFITDLNYFIQRFEAKAHVSDEIKGSQLTMEQRLKICNFIKKNKSHLVIIITMADSDKIPIDDLIYFRINQATTFIRNKESYIERGGQSQSILDHFDKIIKIAEYSSRLSNEEFLQSVMLVKNIRDTLQSSIVYFMDWKYAKSFRNYQFFIDRKLDNKLSSMEKYIKTNLKAFIQDIPGANNRLVLPDIWKKGHPFIDEYSIKEYELNGDTVPEVIDLNGIFKNDIQFVDSKEKPGLKLIDMVCNSVYSYLVNPEDIGYKTCYEILRHSMSFKKGKCISQIELRKQ